MATSNFMGVDLGSTTAKAVVITSDGVVTGGQIVQMGAVSRKGVEKAIQGALTMAGLTEQDLSYTIGTGYGRRLVPGVGRTFTEITCHARGVAALFPEARLVIDVGGQDSKVIALDDQGLVDRFALNDRCASGTGRFYEVLARALECEIGEVGPLAMQGTKDLDVSTMCATFAETEIISLLAGGAEPADVAASVHRAIAHRALGLVAQVGKRSPIVMTGGVAKNSAAVHFLEQELHQTLQIPEDPQIMGAFGAALLAMELSTGRTLMQLNTERLTQLELEVEAAMQPNNRPLPNCMKCYS
ncbi:acyl-CoA dehydratase activase [Spongiibacter taiwanensis]|uniref:acyl-CoA dehydratase activase n=1 Tax=Spongiibacter taiwanensis TaxID=1748242 RepID=UPI0020365079|nr:acyl-CoA dehydratase activase [Spongiibacter taiwanensis]USA42003.1 acyl-CoA dehydratase activase [Spongiibacter taiwanensis]